MKTFKSHLLIINFFLLLLNPLVSQNDSSFHKFEIGIDASSLIDRIIPHSGEFYSTPRYDYYLNLKYHLDKCSFRIRFGGKSNKRTNESNFSVSAGSGQSADEYLTSYYNFAFGLDKRFYLKEKISINLGTELMLHFFNRYHHRVFISGDFQDQKTKSISYGTNLIGGFQFYIKPWLSIGSEASITYYKSETKNSNEYTATVDNNNSIYKESDFDFLATNGIFIIVHF